MNAAQNLARRAERRERQIVGAFLEIAETAGMTPAQVAASAVVVYADIRTKPVRVWRRIHRRRRLPRGDQRGYVSRAQSELTWGRSRASALASASMSTT